MIDYKGTLFFVSHDRYFINRIATKVVELSEDGTRLYLGDYDYYLEKKQEEEELAEYEKEEEPQEKTISAGKKILCNQKSSKNKYAPCNEK
ncbi:ATP-binding component of an ABC superfamily transporter [Tetragenococcus muriaticus 3MR10-3]|uniref:ATP-binding component of an ABC superfamily transporter n=1 Tax=Tetragenococcus muriaticus 3MR10-3 TaxID=1302648 RepID=A0A091BXB6_9ENTE|nr:ATP-binding component of an ABC superfamily transporter [Tetragenococcus muriaticus 3MR10-3]